MSHLPDKSPEANAPPPLPDSCDAIPDDPRLAKAIQAYLEELESGRRPDRRQWLDRYPELADALAQCFDGLELVHRAAPLASPLSGTGRRLASQPSDALLANPLGDFQIVREIGRGGMGIVYEAIQLSLGRRVALKVLPFAATFDAKHLRRFLQEAQAAAQLHHTNIVPVYAVGCERGIHYYAMQLIEGHSLDLLVRQMRREQGLAPFESPFAGPSDSDRELLGSKPISATGEWRPSPAINASPGGSTDANPPDTVQTQFSSQFSNYPGRRDFERYRAIAKAMAQAAEALEYAHQQGVVHRDIKPANLLIDAAGSIWITDFGLAQLHDAPGLTQTGDILGTIRYMSPEQASGQRIVLDHRTDIYSLGATFYELLTLQPMFGAKTRQALLHDVLNREPRPPRSIDRRIPSELDTILQKALGKSAGDRYASAQELADDLHRYLRDEPIRAKRPSLLESTRKWSRRHPSLVAAAVLVMFLSLLGSLIGNWLITKANDRTKAALIQERLRAEEAEKSFQQARQAVDFLIKVGQDELGDEPPLRGLRKRILEAAVDYYQTFIAERRGNPAMQNELIAVQNQLKKVLDDLSVLEGAGQLVFLSQVAVQNDLRLDEHQRSHIAEIVKDFDRRRLDSLHNFNQLSFTERQSRFLGLARSNDQAMRATLTQAQLRRLEQITLQLQGPRAFTQPEVIAALHLTDQQREKIRQIEIDAFAPMWDMPIGHKRPSPDRFGEFVQPALEQALTVLTPEQLDLWKQLTGEPFRGSWTFRRRVVRITGMRRCSRRRKWLRRNGMDNPRLRHGAASQKSEKRAAAFRSPQLLEACEGRALIDSRLTQRRGRARDPSSR